MPGPWIWGLSLATYIARLDGADVPRLSFSMDGAKPPSTDAAMRYCGRLAVLSHGRNGFTGPFEVTGIGVIRLLQHIPSSCGQYTRSSRRSCHREELG